MGPGGRGRNECVAHGADQWAWRCVVEGERSTAGCGLRGAKGGVGPRATRCGQAQGERKRAARWREGKEVHGLELLGQPGERVRGRRVGPVWAGLEREKWATGLGLSLGFGFWVFLGPGFGYCWADRVWVSFYFYFYFSSFLNLNQTKFEFKYKFEFKPHSNN